MQKIGRPRVTRASALILTLLGVVAGTYFQAGAGIAGPGQAKAVSPGGIILSADEGESDYPAACAAPDGSAWAAWQTYSGGSDRLFVAHWTSGQWQSALLVPSVQGDVYKPACGVDQSGRLVLVWSQQLNSDWDLWSSFYDGKSWSEPRKVIARKGTDFAPRMARAPDGWLAVVWQAWTGDSFDVLLSEWHGRNWREPEVVTDNSANDWYPALAFSPDGAINVSWDSYRNGDYDVFLRRKKSGEWSAEIPVACSNRFEGYSSLAADSNGTVWIAYEERTEQWGKDRGATVSSTYDELDTLLGFSSVKVRCYREGALLDPAQPPKLQLTPYDWGGDHSPQIAVGPDDRVWLAFRRPTIDQPGWNGKPLPESAAVGTPDRRTKGYMGMIPYSSRWNSYAAYLRATDWSMPMPLDATPSRVDSDLAAVSVADGGLLTVWHSENRSQKGSGAFRYAMPTKNKIHSKFLPSPAGAVAPPKVRTAEQGPYLDPVAPARERSAVELARNYRLNSNGKTYRLYRGDLHRHTDISWDGASDASITDMFRYAMDAASLDFVVATDHNRPPGIDVKYVWWRTQKITDVFHAPPRFITLFGYERSVSYPQGHRNIIEAKRGFRAFPVTRAVSGGGGIPPDDTKQLYDHVRTTGGITIPHQIGETGTAWTDNDAVVEPIVEIFQGCRNSYEYEGAPRTPSRLKPRGVYTPQGFLWNAWRKGYRLGVIASSDHQSTHISYANVYALDATRESILEAMRQRHTFGSTDNIVLDFRAGEHLQGDDFSAKAPPPFYIHVLGTAPVTQLVIIKNYEFVYTTRSENSSLALEWKDTAPAPGTSMYYVRVLQANREIAWSSPVWVTLQ